MTRGVLLVAFNNSHFDYIKMAAWNADRIKHFLELPVCLITDRADHPQINHFDHVITVPRPHSGKRYFDDIQTTVDWINYDRSHAALQSPFDHTLVLDVDYVVNSDQLGMLFDVDQDFVCHRSAVNACTGEIFNTTFGKYHMPMYWATVMCFRRSPKAQVIFDIMTMVQHNWQHYRDLYQIDRPAFRNDHALSIALNIESGHTLHTVDIPWNLVSVLPGYELRGVDRYRFEIVWQEQRGRRVIIQNQDFHAMGKSHLEKIIDDQG